MTVYFDMDGTIADLYGVENWLADLLAEDTRPYEIARPLVSCERLRVAIENRKRENYKFGVISWTSRNGSPQYNRRVRKAKVAWLNKYFPDCFEEIHVVKHGTPKYKVAKDKAGWLFDDEEQNRNAWKLGASFSEKEIFSQLE